MVVYIRNILVGIGVVVFWGIILAKSLMPIEWKSWLTALAAIIFSTTFVLALLLNKIFYGTFAPYKVTEKQREKIQKQQISFTRINLKALLSVLIVGLPLTLLLK